jgi:hypothetical protein
MEIPVYHHVTLGHLRRCWRDVPDNSVLEIEFYLDERNGMKQPRLKAITEVKPDWYFYPETSFKI